jgi:hypothetical protein
MPRWQAVHAVFAPAPSPSDAPQFSGVHGNSRFHDVVNIAVFVNIFQQVFPLSDAQNSSVPVTNRKTYFELAHSGSICMELIILAFKEGLGGLVAQKNRGAPLPFSMLYPECPHI